MPRIVAVHGIGQQFKGPHLLHQRWLAALRDGLARVGATLPHDEDLVCAFYGDLFRPNGKVAADPPYDAEDVTAGLERDLLDLWWREAARAEDTVVGPDAQTKVRTPQVVQRALNALSQSAFFADVAERALIGDLKQVRAYLSDNVVRGEVQQRVARDVTEDTRILIGHSLGTVAAYEALAAHPDWPVHTFISLGSPLGIRHLIFDRLRPAPIDDTARWPARITRWTNIADGGDIVALVKALRPRFGQRIEDLLIHNGAHVHDVEPYLTAEETGRAIASALAE
jgi:hypothetical protein